MMPDSRFPAGTFDPSDDVAVKPVPALATATLIQYEWKAADVTQYGDAITLNALFADGWQFDSVAGNVYLLKRQVTQE